MHPEPAVFRSRSGSIENEFSSQSDGPCRSRPERMSPMTTRFGIFVPQGWKMDLAQIADPIEQWEAMTAVAKRADDQSWDSIWLFDHFHTVPEPSDNTTFECWSATAALARDTD